MNNRLKWQAGAYEENVEPLSLVGSQSPVLIDCINSDTLNCINPLGIGSVNYTAGKTYFNNAGAYEQSTYTLTDTLKVTEGLRFTWDQSHNNSQLITYIFRHSVPRPAQHFQSAQQRAQPFPAVTCIIRRIPARRRGSSTSITRPPTTCWCMPNIPVVIAPAAYRRKRRLNLPPSSRRKSTPMRWASRSTFHAVVSGTFNIAAFYNNFRDQQLQLNLNPKPGARVSPASAILNAGKSRISGVEIETSLNLFEGFVLSTSYTWLDTRIQEVTTPVTPASSPYAVVSPVAVGDQLTLSPKNKVSTTGTYTLPVAESIGKIAMSATFTHTGSQITNYVDGTSPNPAINSLGTLPALNLLNLDMSWNSIMGSRLGMALFASNLTNKTYFTYVPGVYNTVGFETAELGQPRFYGVRLRYTW